MAIKKSLAKADAIAMIDEAALSPSLDELFSRAPKTHTLEDRRIMVEHLRRERAAWEVKNDKRAAKKEGVEPTEYAGE